MRRRSHRSDAGGRFAVDLNSGHLTAADGTLLGHETNAIHNITVRATLGGLAAVFGGIVWVEPALSDAFLELGRGENDYNLADRMSDREFTERMMMSLSIAVSTSVYVGDVTWMLRGGSLLTTLMSSSPAWQSFEPLATTKTMNLRTPWCHAETTRASGVRICTELRGVVEVRRGHVAVEFQRSASLDFATHFCRIERDTP